MELNIYPAEEITAPRDKVVFDVACSAGDADYHGSFKVTVNPDCFVSMYLQLLMVQEQFPNGRDSAYHCDQENYFGPSIPYYVSKEDRDRLDIPQDDYWTFFDGDREDEDVIGMLPRDGDINYTIDEIVATYYDRNGIANVVEVNDMDTFLAEFAELNKKHRLGDYEVWDKEAKHQYCNKYATKLVEPYDFVKPYLDYRKEAVALLEKWVWDEADQVLAFTS